MDWDKFEDIVKEKYSEDATNRTDMYEACEAAYLMGQKEPVADVLCNVGLSCEWKSFARWPHNDNTHMTSDKHETKEQAEAVCKRLEKEGWGGEGKMFPLETSVREVKKAR